MAGAATVAPVLIRINGPFGGGRTHTAYEPARRLPGGVGSDPEHLGSGIHRMLPRALRAGFQGFPAWRRGVREVLEHLPGRHDGAVIVPMTLVEPVYFEQVVGALRDGGHDVRHVALPAGRETVLRRLRGRGPLPGGAAGVGVRRTRPHRPPDGPAGRRGGRGPGGGADRPGRRRPAAAAARTPLSAASGSADPTDSTEEPAR